MLQLKRLAAVLLLAAAGAPAALADDVQISAFYGRFEGTGVTEKLETVHYGLAAPDLDVEIGPTADGFYVSYIAVDRESPDPASEKVKRQTVRIQFVPSGHSGTYRSATPDSKVGGNFAWAMVSGQSLQVHFVGQDAGGGLEVQSYERTLTELGMTAEYSRVRNAAQLLFLRGRMIKVSRAE